MSAAANGQNANNANNMRGKRFDPIEYLRAEQASPICYSTPKSDRQRKRKHAEGRHPSAIAIDDGLWRATGINGLESKISRELHLGLSA